MGEDPKNLPLMVEHRGFLAPRKNWNNIEQEMLMKVLSYLHSPTNPKEMASRRLVCKHWRNVIDEYFENYLTVNDTKFDMQTVSHVRVKNCTVVNLTKKLDPQNPVFNNPKSLLTLSIWGDISPENFHLLLEQAVNLKQLSLTWKALTTVGLMNSPIPEWQRRRFNDLWNGLRTLEISHAGMTDPDTVTDNLSKISSASMQNLSTLKLRVGFNSQYGENFHSNLYAFLESPSSRNLKTFHFYWYFVEGSLPPPQSPLRFSGENQLESLRLSLLSDLVPYWIPVIEAQRELTDFRLNFRIDFCDRFREHTRLREVLESTLPLNRDTLKTVELSRFNLSDEFNANVFQNMENLTRLVLRPCQFQGSFQKILNLGLLPNSIETLVLGKVSVDSDEIKLLVDRLENIKVLELMGTKIRGEFVLIEIFEMLTRKDKIQRITVNPLDSRIRCESKSGKAFLVVNGYEMEVLTKDFTPSINFSFR